MSYWGERAEDSDFATGAVGVAILNIKRNMEKETSLVLEKKFPEQSIVASLICLRLLGERFPKNLSVHFRRKHFEAAKKSFYDWYSLVELKLPDEWKAGILEEAEREFELFEERILKKRSQD